MIILRKRESWRHIVGEVLILFPVILNKIPEGSLVHRGQITV